MENEDHSDKGAAAPAPSADDSPAAPASSASERTGCERVGDRVEETIHGTFHRIGKFCSYRPKLTIGVALGIAIACAGGMAKLNTESRPEKVRERIAFQRPPARHRPTFVRSPADANCFVVPPPCPLTAVLASSPSRVRTICVLQLWVPQNTEAEAEQDKFLNYFPPSSRFEQVIATSSSSGGGNVLTKDALMDAMRMHQSIATGTSTVPEEERIGGEGEEEEKTFADLCAPGGGSCAEFDFADPICTCLVISVLKVRGLDAPIRLAGSISR